MFDAVKELAAKYRPATVESPSPSPGALSPSPSPDSPSPRFPESAQDAPAESRAAEDARHMARALALAARGINSAHPNPRVGCVIVAAGEVVGEGWHRRAGGEHAETIALRAAGRRAAGACAYLNLEPCSHYGRTPPCADALIEAGIGRAVIAISDPNPRVDGGGIAALRQAGVDVTLGVGAAAAEKLNRGFCARFTAGRPFVTLKMAATIDGKTALANGESQWLTGEAARRDAHKLRAASSAILTGAGTVLRDDPRMTARLDDAGDGAGRQPLRVILDGNLSTPPSANILRAAGRALIITAPAGVEAAEADALRGPGVEVIACRARRGRIDLAQVMRELAAREVNELLVEAGPRLSGALLKSRLVDQVVLYLAPDALGGGARGMFESPALESLAARHRLEFADARRVGRDLRLTLDVGDGDSAAPRE